MNCLIYRLNAGRDFVRGRSRCLCCEHELAWRDLIPVLSYLELGGHCRYCGKSISIQYPLVELAVGILFAAAAVILAPGTVFGFNLRPEAILNLVYYWAVISALVVIFVYDLRWYLISDGVIAAALTFSGLFYAGHFFYEYSLTGTPDFETLANPVLAALLAFSFFLTIFLVSNGKWMGFGDVKFSFLMGMILGFPGILPGLFFAFSLGAIIGLSLISAGKKRIGSEIPFGPFLATGTLIALFFGEKLFDWYLAIGCQG